MQSCKDYHGCLRVALKLFNICKGWGVPDMAKIVTVILKVRLKNLKSQPTEEM